MKMYNPTVFYYNKKANLALVQNDVASLVTHLFDGSHIVPRGIKFYLFDCIDFLEQSSYWEK